MRARAEDQTIRELRAELQADRCMDKDHIGTRYFFDGQRLDIDLWLLCIPCKRTTCGDDPEKLRSKRKHSENASHIG